MKRIVFDFKKIKNKKDFYNELAEKVQLPEYFGYNLDALWDIITSGEIDLPTEVIFINFDNRKNKFFVSLEELFKDAEKETDKKIVFKFYSGEK